MLNMPKPPLLLFNKVFFPAGIPAPILLKMSIRKGLDHA